jgi:hypothetical protein
MRTVSVCASLASAFQQLFVTASIGRPFLNELCPDEEIASFMNCPWQFAISAFLSFAWKPCLRIPFPFLGRHSMLAFSRVLAISQCTLSDQIGFRFHKVFFLCKTTSPSKCSQSLVAPRSLPMIMLLMPDFGFLQQFLLRFRHWFFAALM